MAKPIPKKKAVKKVARKKQIEKIFDPRAQKGVEKQIKDHLMALDERSEERQKYVDAILRANDDSIEEIVDAMVENLGKMQGPPRLVVGGQAFNATEAEQQLLENIQRRNFRWIAVRVLAACARWDIRIGNFTLPKKICVVCGTKTTKVSKKGGKK